MATFSVDTRTIPDPSDQQKWCFRRQCGEHRQFESVARNQPKARPVEPRPQRPCFPAWRVRETRSFCHHLSVRPQEDLLHRGVPTQLPAPTQGFEIQRCHHREPLVGLGQHARIFGKVLPHKIRTVALCHDKTGTNLFPCSYALHTLVLLDHAIWPMLRSLWLVGAPTPTAQPCHGWPGLLGTRPLLLLPIPSLHLQGTHPGTCKYHHRILRLSITAARTLVSGILTLWRF